MRRTAENNVNYQIRSLEFRVGDKVSPYGYFDNVAGRVVAVYPAIGMVDVEFPTGQKRYPVEEVQRFDDNGNSIPPVTDSVPGGTPTVFVPNGPDKAVRRVASEFVKRALYWSGPNRQYRPSRSEVDGGCYSCPRCEDQTLRKAIYKRREGRSENLLGCPGCLFLIKEIDLHLPGGE